MNGKLVLAAALVSVPAIAPAQQPEEKKHFSVGLVSFASSLGYNRNEGYGEVTETETFSGPGVFFTGAINDNFAMRLTRARQEHETDASYELTATEGSVLLGTGLATEGLRAYGSVGFYNETLEYEGYYSGEEDFSGLALGGGIGYNWRPITLEFWLSAREASDYENFLERSNVYGNTSGDSVSDVVAMTGGLGLSFRF